MNAIYYVKMKIVYTFFPCSSLTFKCVDTVTTVGAAEMAMTMLSKGKERYDVMIINAYSPDLLSTQLLGQAVELDIISICEYFKYCYSE